MLAIVSLGLAPDKLDSFYADDKSSEFVESEHHAITRCSGHGFLPELFLDLFQGAIFSTFSQLLNQPHRNRWVKFFT